MDNLKKIASKNKKYYLSEQKEDSGSERWFKYVKTLKEYLEPVLITPEMARELLDDFSFKKPTSPNILKTVSLKNASIDINFSGKLILGHVVLEAILMYNDASIVLVRFNVSDRTVFS